MHGIPKTRTFDQAADSRIPVNGLAAGRVHRTHGHVSIRRVRVTIWVAGFTHGSAHWNPFTTDNLPRTRRRIVQREKISPCQVDSLCSFIAIPNTGKVELLWGMPKRLSYIGLPFVSLFLYDISLCIHQDMVPQTSSTVDT
jgi:hypothetical protein